MKEDPEYSYRTIGRIGRTPKNGEYQTLKYMKEPNCTHVYRGRKDQVVHNKISPWRCRLTQSKYGWRQPGDMCPGINKCPFIYAWCPQCQKLIVNYDDRNNKITNLP